MARQDISMIRGRTMLFIIRVTDADGKPYTLADGEVLRFGVKVSKVSTSYLLEKELTAADAVGDGYGLRLAPEDTAAMPAGPAIYDVGLQSGEDYITVIEPSVFYLAANVTAKEVD